MVYTLRFFSSKCSLFHNSNVFGSCTIHILYTGCAKIKIIPAPKGYSVGSTRPFHNDGYCDVWQAASVSMRLAERGGSEGALPDSALLRDPYPICVHSLLHFPLGFILLVWSFDFFSDLGAPPPPSNTIFCHQTHLFLATTFQFHILSNPKASLFTPCCLLPLCFVTNTKIVHFILGLFKSEIVQLFTYCIISNTRSKECI